MGSPCLQLLSLQNWAKKGEDRGLEKGWERGVTFLFIVQQAGWYPPHCWGGFLVFLKPLNQLLSRLPGIACHQLSGSPRNPVKGMSHECVMCQQYHLTHHLTHQFCFSLHGRKAWYPGSQRMSYCIQRFPLQKGSWCGNTLLWCYLQSSSSGLHCWSFLFLKPLNTKWIIPLASLAP